MQPDVIVIHYSEIGTKGENREFFERALIKNLKGILGTKRVVKRYGKILVELGAERGEKSALEKFKEKLALCPGVEYFAFARACKLDVESMKKLVESYFEEITKTQKFDEKSFKIETQRSNKSFAIGSQECNKILGEAVASKFAWRVSLKNPAVRIFVEIGEQEIVVYHEKLRGVGGLPVGVSGKIACSFSGGIDSPVAAFMMMKRGCVVELVHFFNYHAGGQNYSLESMRWRFEKIEKLAKRLAEIQGQVSLVAVPFEEFQSRVVELVPGKYRMLIYRRAMMQAIARLAEQNAWRGIVTGDSLGQVASQTLDNLKVIFAAGDGIPKLAPLVGLNKNEIIEIAKKIGTYELSVLPYPDCCSFMIARHPETRARLSEIERLEGKLEIDKWVERAVNERKEFNFKASSSI